MFVNKINIEVLKFSYFNFDEFYSYTVGIVCYRPLIVKLFFTFQKGSQLSTF